MDPVTLLVAALTGAVAKLAEPAVKDAYEGLKALIRRKFSQQADVLMLVDKHEQKPEAYAIALEDSLRDSDIPNDSEVQSALRELEHQLQSVSNTGGDVLGENARKIVQSGSGTIATDNARIIGNISGDYNENK